MDAQLDKLRAQLADLSSHYTDLHPDVRKVKEQIAETETMRDQHPRWPESQEIRTGGSGCSQHDPDPAAMRDASSPMVQLQGQLQSNRVEIANREHGVEDLKTKLSTTRRD